MIKKRKILFYTIFTVLLLVGTLMLAELTGLVLISFHISDIPSRSEIRKTLDIRSVQRREGDIYVSEEQLPSWMQPHILHPYLGFVRNHMLPRQVFNNRVINVPVNEYGFFGHLPGKHKSDEKVTIAITGGSVALELYLYAGDILKSELQNSQEFAGKNIELICLALGGMKQPQQLMALNYFLALGYHFDMIVNCDGFNEVALPFAQNIPYNIFPYYPRAWGIYAAKSMNIQVAVLYGKLSESKKKQEKWRSVMSKSPFRQSHLSLLLWHLISSREERKQNAFDQQIRELVRLKKHRHPQETGPSYAFSTNDELFSDLAEMWKESSSQMWKICAGYDIDYYHFLQPNQYVKNSKTLSNWERKHIYADPNNLSRQSVEQAYPDLMATGKDLTEQGVPFFDLTNLFQNNSETVYRDNSCHYNQLGNELLAKRIANVLSTY